MAKRVSAKDRIAEQTESFLQSVSKSIDTAAKEAAHDEDPISKLERMAKDFAEVHVKIEKKQRNGSKFELWTELTLPVEDIMNRGTDSICKEQGGGGHYRVRVRAPGDKQARFVTEHSIAGPPLEQPRADYDMGLGAYGAMGSIPGFGNIAGNASPRSGQPSGFGSGSQSGDPTKLVEAMSKQFDRTLSNTQSAADRNNQLMMTMLMTMMSNNNQQGQASRGSFEDLETRKQIEKMRDEMANLQRERERERARFEKLESERKMEAQLAQRDKELAELKNMLQMNHQKGGEKDWLIPLITAMSSGQSSQTQTMVELMKMAQSKPSELEMFGNFISTVSTVMNGQFEGQARLLEVVKDALSGGEEHPIRDAILRGMDGLMSLGSEALQAQSMRAQQVAEAQVMPPRVSETPPQMQPVGSMQGLPEHEEEYEEEVAGDEEPDLLTEEEFDRMERDAALQKVIAVLFNGEHPSEATARLFRHANSGNTIARKWLQWPYDVSEQVLVELLGTTITAGPKNTEVDLAKALGDDIIAFSEYLDNRGNPDKWAKSGYPLNEKKIRQDAIDPALLPSKDVSSVTERSEEAEQNQELEEEVVEPGDIENSEK